MRDVLVEIMPFVVAGEYHRMLDLEEMCQARGYSLYVLCVLRLSQDGYRWKFELPVIMISGAVAI